MADSHRRLVALSLVVLVVLAGCAGMGGNDAAKDNAAHGNGGGSNHANRGSSNGRSDSAQQSALSVQQRMLIRNGNVSLSVEDFEETRTTLARLAGKRGGFVSDSSQRVHRRGNRTWKSGEVVFRVPKSNFSAFFDRVKRQGEVGESNTGTVDVTDQLVDLKARLTNLRSQRDKLRSLYENASDTDAVLSVQKRLSDVQSEIERLEAKQKSLKNRVAYSTVTVTMRESVPASDTKVSREKSWYDTGVVAAFLDSIDGVAVVLRALVVGAAYALPYLAVLGVPVGAMVVFWRRQ
ncbi:MULTISPECIES: DUF4349 domain-containing protein [unclassified Haladaptatus]|uniref:DUF4349 domain-containing protein n=1 Tax=unclassified Haladaptatus TaxID=2622732 RepID=UPI00209BD187|nr:MULTISPECIES: DUF4349 domain-containing protein [unclassified Haladaptatus]MCO8245875.1 DUF4349 domain-containing protein [Haladaptatus sp. AB643]MCO8254505.1 DUF4349 domain-containing protein [Haladaptatus sp. AB618]